MRQGSENEMPDQVVQNLVTIGQTVSAMRTLTDGHTEKE